MAGSRATQTVTDRYLACIDTVISQVEAARACFETDLDDMDATDPGRDDACGRVVGLMRMARQLHAQRAATVELYGLEGQVANLKAEAESREDDTRAHGPARSQGIFIAKAGVTGKRSAGG
jgi:hypothetical protein